MLQTEEMIDVSISADEMEAYLMLATPMSKDDYSVELLKEALADKGVVHGINEEKLKQMLDHNMYELEVQVAFGTPVIDGIDGYYEYNFRTHLDKKPQIRKDGSVDYWSVNLIETVVEGQVIAIYQPAKSGQSGKTVKDNDISPKIGRELSPLKGKGFERNNDNLTYVALTDGKIEMVNGRINIFNVHEIYGNIDTVYGDINFNGDIVIHGNISAGMSVKTNGNLSVDGVVEGANIWVGKDLILRGGVIGDGKGEIFAKGDVFAKFFEFAKITCEGKIEADVLMQCEVNCKKSIVLHGKRGAIIGGTVSAVSGIEVNDIGNISEISTDIAVGLVKEARVKMDGLNEDLEKYTASLESINKGLAVFTQLEEERGVSYRDHPSRMKLLRERIKISSLSKAAEAELQAFKELEQQSKDARVKVNHTVYPGTSITIGMSKATVKEEQIAVEYVLRAGKVVLRGEQIVG